MSHLAIKSNISNHFTLTFSTPISKKFQSSNFYTSLKFNPNPLRQFAMSNRTAGTASAKPPLVVKSSLIDPDGGVLVNLVVTESERSLKAEEGGKLPKVKLTRIDFEWVHVISEGWASPLKGFMREKEYLQSLHFNSLRLENGAVVNMSLPIVLAIDDETKGKIGTSADVGLVAPDGSLIAILKRFCMNECSFLILKN